MATVTALNVPQRTYNQGQSFGPQAFGISAGAVGMQFAFTNPSGWPLGDIATITLEISYDNGVTFSPLGGLTVNGDTQGVTDPNLGVISGATFKAGFPQPATATTKGRASAQVLQTFTTAISVNTMTTL